ncbi:MULTISPECIES: RNA polymerase sigma factor [Olivibacter]|jgi:RNA polymerase sigma-70 factor (ECF subfamily)|uniref:RNA polymerase sigma factor n=2 Tax=Olivibacter TaxID=376469 RepID=A0ABV6HDR8_9SPHI|nr:MULTISPECIES: RNA polymerase sigma-70 factor [Olivibacter]MCL4637832.1 RNA polymerase sigma-70 factor [Olivibacter sp. UJ_SKK_5.1]MDM8177846.1 RNA polymerase sigma-70 factor [Olivibacter sp. 47]MDX3916242.1 RNA polymerase sigma-70 factor [Pseudosphingobacterium sp.]QEK99542.1 RNA polymerase sigma-70 factor [Olivibacter sp. LS-1]
MSSYKLYTDNELIHLLAANDTAAFSEIYLRYGERLYKQAYHVLRNREDAKDIVQDIFTSLWNKRTGLQINNLAAYLYIANRNQTIKLIAHKKITSVYFDWLQALAKEVSDNAHHTLLEKQLNQLVEDEVSKLPSKMQAVFNLSRKAHLSHKEIAAKLHLSEATVKTQVKNALRILRSKLEAFLYAILFLLYWLF